MVYVAVLTAFLIGNDIAIWKPIVLLILYIAHILLMKYNHVYEVAIKKGFARRSEIKKLLSISQQDLSYFHRNLASRHLSIETLNQVLFTVEDNEIVFENLTK